LFRSANAPHSFPGLAALRGRGRAFSLAELLVVSSIIIVLSTTAVLGYRNLRVSDDVTTTARRIQVTLQRARTLAISSGQAHEFVLDIDERLFWVDNVDPADAAPKVDGLGFGSEFVRVAGFRENGGALLTSGERRLRFEPDGRSSFAVIQLIREGENDTVDENFATVRLFPHGEVRVERRRVNS
jgi:Tfp pilus assembly protein FimT